MYPRALLKSNAPKPSTTDANATGKVSSRVAGRISSGIPEEDAGLTPVNETGTGLLAALRPLKMRNLHEEFESGVYLLVRHILKPLRTKALNGK